MAIKMGDRIKHRDNHVGTALTDEHGGTVQVKQDDGAITIWSAGDTTLIAPPSPAPEKKKK
ncbi:MAG: hypothetical protein JWL69_3883 [Phycisphaerales bacterium]|nr:hypothetical protein [Phycisphaerales bacterium]MDB5354739.1 hypothetical protein [Phycisphaerales bacterium]